MVVQAVNLAASLNEEPPPPHDSAAAMPAAAAVEEFTPNIPLAPDKAAQWVQHAAGQKNFALALQYWVFAHKADVTNQQILEKMLETGTKIAGDPRAAKTARSACETAIKGEKHPANDYLVSLVRIALDPMNAALAAEAANQAHALNIKGAACFLANRAVRLAEGGHSKLSVKQFKALAGVTQHFYAYDLAERAVNAALIIAPKDYDLERLKNTIVAEGHIHKQRLEKTADQEGAFVGNIRDRETQERLQAEAKTTPDEELLATQIQEARRAYFQNQDDEAALEKLLDLLEKSGTQEDLDDAHELIDEAFAQSQKIKWKFRGDDLTIKSLEGDVRLISNALKEAPDDDGLKKDLAAARKALLDAKCLSAESRFEQYKTDAKARFDLAVVYSELGRHDEALVHLQRVADDLKLGVKARCLLGFEFLQLEWYEEAIVAFELTLQKVTKAGAALADVDAQEVQKLHFGLASACFHKGAAAKNQHLIDKARDELSLVLVADINFPGAKELREQLLSALGPLCEIRKGIKS